MAITAASLLGLACATIPATGSRAMRVMTYNIQYGHEGLDSVAEVIRGQRPDIIGLQEVDVHWNERSNFVDQAESLAKRTGMNYRFARIYQLANSDPTKPPREFGVAILTRYPIVSFTNHPITRLSTQEENPQPEPLPGLLEAILDVNGTKVRVFNVHLDYRRDPSVRAQQAADILKHVGTSTMPTLMLGDMNARPDAPEIQPLFARFRDTWPYHESPGWTSPAKAPTGKIDYVLTSNGFSVVKTWIPQVYASDHLPVVVDLMLQQGTRVAAWR